MKWIHVDPESGYQLEQNAAKPNEFIGGRSLAEEFPNQYFPIPDWAAWVFSWCCEVQRFGANFISRWDNRERKSW